MSMAAPTMGPPSPSDDGRPLQRAKVLVPGFEAHLVKPVEPEDLLRALAGERLHRQDKSR